MLGNPGSINIPRILPKKDTDSHNTQLKRRRKENEVEQIKFVQSQKDHRSVLILLDSVARIFLSLMRA